MTDSRRAATVRERAAWTVCVAASVLACAAFAADPPPLEQPANTWVKRSPLPDGPVSPRMGYEGDCRWDPIRRVMIRYGGHNQGGGGEQNSELWLFDPWTGKWTLREPNISPPGLCCGQQNVFDAVVDRYVRFPSFSASHGWQWHREVYLNDWSVWTYDVAGNMWRNMRPVPSPHVGPLRCASWDSEAQVIVLFGGEGSREGTLVYDPYANEWTRMNPPMEPESRSAGNMAYDTANRRHILFGAQFQDDPHTWAYDLRENRWHDMKPPLMPHTDRNDAVLAYDARHKVVIAVVKITTGKDDSATHRLETWAYNTAANRWTKMNPPREPDPTSDRARQLTYSPQLGMMILENRTNRPAEQQIWTYRYADDPPTSGLEAPTNLRLVTGDASVTLHWSPPGGGTKAWGYLIQRGTGETPWQVTFEEATTLPASATSWTDPTPRRDRATYYAVSALSAGADVGPRSAIVRTQPRAIEDLHVSVKGTDRVELSWPAGPDDIAGYHVERAVVEVLTEDQLRMLKSRTKPLEEPSVGAIVKIGAFRTLTPAPVTERTYVDSAADLTKPAKVEGDPLYERRFHNEQLDASGRSYRYAVYAYRVRAVNRLGVVGGPSPAVLTIPSPPMSVFSREDGGKCHVKWAAHPDESLRGFRVYRMNGRWDKDSISRLNDEPIREPRFTDMEAGEDTRRYYIVAVDAIGQEGFPSAPTWFDREWKQYYEPFVGEWHQ